MLHFQEVRKKEENVSDVHWHGFSFNQPYLCIFLHSWHINHVKLIISDWNFPVTIRWNTSIVLVKLLGNNEDRRRWSSSWEPISYLYSPHTPLFFFFPPFLKQCIECTLRVKSPIWINSGMLKALTSPAVKKPALLCSPQQVPILLGHRPFLKSPTINYCSWYRL